MIEDLVKCNYRAPFETLRSSSRLKGSGVIELNRMTAIEAKLDALRNKMGNHERRMHSENEVGTTDENEKLRRHSISMQIEVTTLSPTSTCQLITHQYSRTMRISLMEKEYNKVKYLGKIFNIMLHLGSNNNNNKEVNEHKIRDKGDLLPLNNRC